MKPAVKQLLAIAIVLVITAIVFDHFSGVGATTPQNYTPNRINR